MHVTTKHDKAADELEIVHSLIARGLLILPDDTNGDDFLRYREVDVRKGRGLLSPAEKAMRQLQWSCSNIRPLDRTRIKQGDASKGREGSSSGGGNFWGGLWGNGVSKSSKGSSSIKCSDCNSTIFNGFDSGDLDGSDDSNDEDPWLSVRRSMDCLSLSAIFAQALQQNTRATDRNAAHGFPVEHLLAIYSPFWAPLVLPMILGAFEFLQW